MIGDASPLHWSPDLIQRVIVDHPVQPRNLQEVQGALIQEWTQPPQQCVQYQISRIYRVVIESLWFTYSVLITCRRTGRLFRNFHKTFFGGNLYVMHHFPQVKLYVSKISHSLYEAPLCCKSWSLAKVEWYTLIWVYDRREQNYRSQRKKLSLSILACHFVLT